FHVDGFIELGIAELAIGIPKGLLERLDQKAENLIREIIADRARGQPRPHAEQQPLPQFYQRIEQGRLAVVYVLQAERAPVDGTGAPSGRLGWPDSAASADAGAGGDSGTAS